MTHPEARLLLAYVDGELDGGLDGGLDSAARDDLLAHLATCTICRQQVSTTVDFEDFLVAAGAVACKDSKASLAAPLAVTMDERTRRLLGAGLPRPSTLELDDPRGVVEGPIPQRRSAARRTLLAAAAIIIAAATWFVFEAVRRPSASVEFLSYVPQEKLRSSDLARGFFRVDASVTTYVVILKVDRTGEVASLYPHPVFETYDLEQPLPPRASVRIPPSEGLDFELESRTTEALVVLRSPSPIDVEASRRRAQLCFERSRTGGLIDGLRAEFSDFQAGALVVELPR